MEVTVLRIICITYFRIVFKVDFESVFRLGTIYLNYLKELVFIKKITKLEFNTFLKEANNQYKTSLKICQNNN